MVEGGAVVAGMGVVLIIGAMVVSGDIVVAVVSSTSSNTPPR